MPEHRLDFKINADRAHERRREAVVRVSEEERRLAHRTVADDQQFEHVVEVLVGGVFLPFWICSAHLQTPNSLKKFKKNQKFHKKKLTSKPK